MPTCGRREFTPGCLLEFLRVLPHAILGQVTLLWLPFYSSEVLPWCGLWSPHSRGDTCPIGPHHLWLVATSATCSQPRGRDSQPPLVPPSSTRMVCCLSTECHWGQLRHHPEVDSAAYPEGHPTQLSHPRGHPHGRQWACSGTGCHASTHRPVVRLPGGSAPCH